jgi:hypothetical protein
MGLGVNTAKPTIPVVWFDAVPIRAIGVDAGRWVHSRRSDRDDTRLGGGCRLGVAVEEGVELRQLQLDGGQGGVHLGLPLPERLVERRRRGLEGGDALLAPLVRQRELGEAVVDDGLVGREAVADLLADLLHELLEQQLDIGIHGTEFLLSTGEVIVLLQSGEVQDRQIWYHLLMSRKVARTAAERERGVRQQLEEEEEPIQFVTVFSDVPSFSPLILFISSSIPGH